MSNYNENSIDYSGSKHIEEILLVGDKVFHQKFGYGIVKTLKEIMLKYHLPNLI